MEDVNSRVVLTEEPDNSAILAEELQDDGDDDETQLLMATLS